MTPERWERIKQTLDHAISLDTNARAAYLASACAGDADLRGEVDSCSTRTMPPATPSCRARSSISISVLQELAPDSRA